MKKSFVKRDENKYFLCFLKGQLRLNHPEIKRMTERDVNPFEKLENGYVDPGIEKEIKALYLASLVYTIQETPEKVVDQLMDFLKKKILEKKNA